jgi:NAD(P)-dependent dehydrogenase (short-subunit alcohol dehydrogenase family)
VDLCPEATPDTWVDALLGVLDGCGEEDQIAWRKGRAFVARLERSRGPARRALTLSPDATYLVVGGFEGLGLLVGRWLAEQGARHIALLGPIPDMNSDGVAAIRGAGAHVIPLAGDVADAAALRSLLDGLARIAPPIRGIVHAATAVSPQIVSMLQPKIAGVLALEQAVQGVDFTVLFSSMASLTGAMGMTHYAAANAFLDASAQRANDNVLAVNWGSWEIDRAAPEAGRAGLQEGHLNALRPAHALEAMGRLIATGVRQMAVADIDWSKFAPLTERLRRRPFLAAFEAMPGNRNPQSAKTSGQAVREAVPAGAGDTTPAMLSDLIAPLPAEDRTQFLEGWVREAIASTLGLTDPESVPSDAGLFDLGMDSLMAGILHRKLERGVGRPLPTTLTFNHHDSRSLARYLATVLGDTGPAPGVSAAAPTAALRDAEIDAMTDAEVEANLRARLERVG